MNFIKVALDSNDTSTIISWGVEPALNKALSIGIAEDLLILAADKYKLTTKGEELFNKIEKDNLLFVDEKEFLNQVGKRKVSEAFINQLTVKISN